VIWTNLFRHNPNLSILFATWLAAIVLFSVPSNTAGQVLYGSLNGTVTDAAGGVLPGAKVSATHVATGQTREALTNESGIYHFTSIPTGKYEINVQQSGFKNYTKKDVEVILNNATRVEIALEVGEVTDIVTVSAGAALLQTDSAEVRNELNEASLNNLPVGLGRNYQQLFKTLPGFASFDEPHSVPSNPSRSLRYHVNGVSRSINNTRIDGASTSNIWLPHTVAYIPALDAIQTVNIVTNSFDAEQGLAGGAAINVQIKSGTNQFHGSLYEFHNNQHLNARNFFDTSKGKLIVNQYGGSLGGPIKKNKLFFFGNYEGIRDHRNASRFETVPTLAARSGDLSASSRAIYDPATGAADGSGRTAFAGKVIPTARINSIVATKLLPLIPLPNRSGETNNYYATGSFNQDRWTVDSKVNWNATKNFSMWGRYSMLDFKTLSSTVFGDQLQGRSISSSNPGNGLGNTYNFSTGGTYIVTPTFVVDGNFGFVRMTTDARHSDAGSNKGLDYLGIPGTNGTEWFEGGMPFFDLTDYSDYGVTDNFMPYSRSDDQYTYVVNANWVKGKHNLRFGADLYRQELNHIQPEFQTSGSLGARGGFQFNGAVTTIRGGQSANMYNSFAAFLLGLPQKVGKLELSEYPFTTRSWLNSLYIRDQWQVHPKLTLSIGTRWEYYPVPTRLNRGLERFNPETNTMLIGGVGAVPMDLGVKVSKTLFAPRAGLAYRHDDKTVLRAGYGITYDPYALARPMRTNHPVLINQENEGLNSFQPYASLSTGIPTVTIPTIDDDGMISVGPTLVVNTLPSEFKRGYIQSWNLSLQRKLKWDFVAEAAYVGTRQTRQLGLVELNWAPLGGNKTTRQLYNVQSSLREASTLMASSIGDSHYDSMVLRLDRRFANGYQVAANYTWAKSIGIAQGRDSDNKPHINIPQYYHLNRAVSDFDTRHDLKITNVIELPFGKGKRWLASNGWLTALASNWQVNNLLNFRTGAPINITASNSNLGGFNLTQRPDQIKEVNMTKRVGSDGTWFDTTAFQSTTAARFGTSGYNSLRGPGYANWDFGVFRQINITENVNVSLRMESFNFTNTPHFDAPERSITSSNFGKVTTSYGERQMRFGVRLGF
jgi:hypothetical protein